MKRKLLSRLGLFALSALVGLGSCTPRTTSDFDPNDPGDPGMMTPMGECTDKQSRCNLSTFQTCSSGKYSDSRTCLSPTVCEDSLGCVACRPGRLTCSGDELRKCEMNGTVGAKIDICAPGQCMNGACLTGSCGAGADLVYVVDQTYRLLSFNPKENKNEFKLIGTLKCPAGPALDGISDSTPFSMSVGRDGTAWVLYTSGEIFSVSTADASCKPTTFQVSQQGMDLFGMGFVTNGNGATDETLHIVGGDSAIAGTANTYASIDPKTLKVSLLGNVAVDMNAPELTGTGKGELWAYFPGQSSTKVARLNKATGASDQEWRLPGLGGSVAAWAFAHWGGRYYIFVTVSGLIKNTNKVLLFDPALGTAPTILDNTPYMIVGAGVSTCAPVILG